MPQLELNLWALTGLTTWSVILGIIPSKIVSHYYTYQPKSQPCFPHATPYALMQPKPQTNMPW